MATDQPFFSIVIPTYNRAGIIVKSIQTVLSQTFSNIEVLVVDDGSTDNTREVVGALTDPRIKYHWKENAERGAARNYGALIARGRFVNFLDSDDLLYPHHLQTAFDFIATNPACDVFHLGFDIKDELGRLVRNTTPIRSINDEILSGNVLSCNGVFVKKEVAEANRFSEDRQLSGLEDWELWIRLCSKFVFLHDNRITSTIIQHSNRSVMETDASKITTKVDRFVAIACANTNNRTTFGKRLNLTQASAWTYAALHLSLSGQGKGSALRYLIKGLRANPAEIWKARFFVIVKNLVTTY